MSFRCGLCKQSVPVGTKATRFVSEWKEGKDPDTGRIVKEIAREINLCPSCVNSKPEKIEATKVEKVETIKWKKVAPSVIRRRRKRQAQRRRKANEVAD